MKISAIGNGRIFGYLLAAVILLNLVGIGFAASGPSSIYSALRDLCRAVNQLLAVAIMLMVILAAVIYAAGQVMGAETRARATVWATAMFTGAIFAAIIYLIVPWMIQTMTGFGGSVSSVCGS